MIKSYLKTINHFFENKLSEEQSNNIELTFKSFQQFITLKDVYELWFMGHIKAAEHLANANLNLIDENLEILLSNPIFKEHDNIVEDSFLGFMGDLIEQEDYKTFYD